MQYESLIIAWRIRFFILILELILILLVGKNIDMDGSFEDALDKSIIFEELMVEIEELKVAREYAKMKIVVLETVKEKEYVLNYKLGDPEKYSERRHVHISA